MQLTAGNLSVILPVRVAPNALSPSVVILMDNFAGVIKGIYPERTRSREAQRGMKNVTLLLNVILFKVDSQSLWGKKGTL